MKQFKYGCKPWNVREDDMLILLHNRQYPIIAIAKILQRTEESIRHRKKKLQLRRVLNTEPKNIIRRRKRKKGIRNYDRGE